MKRFKFLLLFCVFACSCVETINLEIPNSDSKIVLFGTLDPEKEIILDLSTSMQVNSPVKIAWPENAEITFSGNVSGSAETNHFFYYSAEQRKYLPANRNIRVKEDEKYHISVKIPGSDIREISAYTEIPGKIEISEFEILDHSNSEKSIALNTRLRLNKKTSLETYLHLIPKLIISPYEIDDLGDTTILASNILSPGTTFFQSFESGEFTYVDESKGVIVSMSNSSNPEIFLSASFLVFTEEYPNKNHTLSLEIQSLTKELYQFIQTTEKQQKAVKDPFLSPVKNFSNVQGGLGLFSGISIGRYEYPIL